MLGELKTFNEVKEFILDNHSEHCKCHPNQTKHTEWDYFCELNPKRFLFFLDNKFFLISYYGCIEYYDHLEFKEMLVKKVIDQYNIYDLYKVNRGVRVSDELAKFRKTTTLNNKIIQQVNYIYSDAAGRQYAITTKIKMLDRIINEDEIKNSYKEAKAYLKQKEYDYLIDELDRLIEHNYLGVCESDIVKTIPHLIKLITKKTKQNATS